MLRSSLPLLLTGLLGCQTALPEPPITVDAATTEAREDSLALVAAYAARELIKPTVSVLRETVAARAQETADAADDPAIWIHPTDPARSLIFGSNKTGGLAAYNLSGQEVSYYPLGKINNVDILTGVVLSGERIDLLGCTNRSDQSVDLLRIDPVTGDLTDVALDDLVVDPQKIDDVYGFCFGRDSTTGTVYAILNGKNGTLQQFRLRDSSGRFALEPVRELSFPSQTEGMVADNELGWLYVGEEAAGIWKLPLVPGENATPRLVATATVANNPAIVADVEGLTLVESGPGTGYLVASIQGNFTYAIFDRAGDNAYLGSFKIKDGPGGDRVEETDGLAGTSIPLPDFPAGILVVQDGFNFDGDTLRSQNFKYVDWGAVLATLPNEPPRK